SERRPDLRVACSVVRRDRRPRDVLEHGADDHVPWQWIGQESLVLRLPAERRHDAADVLAINRCGRERCGRGEHAGATWRDVARKRGRDRDWGGDVEAGVVDAASCIDTAPEY